MITFSVLSAEGAAGVCIYVRQVQHAYRTEHASLVSSVQLHKAMLGNVKTEIVHKTLKRGK